MLVDLTVKEFLNKVAGSDPVPGGGSIAALNGAIASALAAMVANLTVGKKGYEAHEELMQHIAGVTLQEKDTFIEDIDRDSEAYDSVFACFKMPKATDEEKAARSAALQEATLYATQVPLRTMKTAFGVFEIVRAMAAVGNPNSVSDAGVGALAARSAVLGAGLNVRINAAGLKDRAAADALVAEADRLAAEAERAEREVLEIVASKI